MTTSGCLVLSCCSRGIQAGLRGLGLGPQLPAPLPPHLLPVPVLPRLGASPPPHPAWMPKGKALQCSVALEIRSVTWPGVVLKDEEDIYLSICVFGQYKKTQCVPATFPLVFNARMVFEKVSLKVRSIMC